MKILVAEDERELSKPLITILRHKGYDADAAYNGREAYEMIKSFGYDLIILDIMMPEMDGLEVLGKIRGEGVYTPVIMLTAKSEAEDKIAGLDSGADDYLAKPFIMGELLARVRALTRRNDAYSPEKLEYGKIELRKNTGEMAGKTTSFRLNNKEYMIAEMFFNSPEREIDAGQIIDRVWNKDEEVDERILDMYVSYVKNKIAAIDTSVVIKSTEKGYIMGAE